MPGGCILFDDNGQINYLNQTMCDLLEYSEAELLNQNIEIIFTVASRIFYQTQLYPLILLKGSVNEIFLSLKSRTGTHVPVMVNVKRISVDEKMYNLGVFVSVWEGQKHERELLKAKEMQKMFRLSTEKILLSRFLILNRRKLLFNMQHGMAVIPA